MVRATTQGGSDFELPPVGYQDARCIRVIDLGTQKVNPYKGQEKPPTRQLLVMFELPKCLTEYEGEEKPMLISRKYNLKFSKKADLRKDMESWYDKQFNDKDIEQAGGFDPAKVVGKIAKIQITHDKGKDGTMYANVGVITPVDAKNFPAQVHPSVVIDLDDLNREAWDGLSEKMQSWIAQSPEFKALNQETSPQKEFGSTTKPGDYDDIPF